MTRVDKESHSYLDCSDSFIGSHLPNVNSSILFKWTEALDMNYINKVCFIKELFYEAFWEGNLELRVVSLFFVVVFILFGFVLLRHGLSDLQLTI